MNVAEVLTVRKTADTSKTNNSMAADPHLKHTGLVAGTYWFQCILRVDAIDTAGFKWLLNGTNGASITSGDCWVTGLTAMAATNITVTTGNGSSGSFNQYALLTIQGEFTTTGTGDVGLEWAQNATNANDTVVKQNSSFMVNRTA